MRLSTQLESREIKRMNFIKAEPVETLDVLVDLTKGPVQWDKIRQSWIVSHKLRGEVRIMTIKNRIVEDICGEGRLLSRLPFNYDIQMEIVEDEGVDYCVDVMESEGENLTSKTLSERLSYFPSSMEENMGIRLQQFFRYNQDTINIMQEYKVVDYVIQNALDTYGRQMRRYASLLIDGREMTPSDFLNEHLSFSNHAEYERDDLEEKSEIRNNKVWKTVIVKFRSVTAMSQAVYLRQHDIDISQRCYDMLSNAKQRDVRYKRCFHTMRHIQLNPGIHPVFQSQGYDVADRVLAK